ncbi:outer membrane protein-like type [Roseibacterium elongatum DSM 19469]|uniref:Outer membrane protein-like type n=1 Tax=Roseicyclus elongatus DSM 19469 TaxID=1294273 RepID=W8RXE9_9RHOB|nr:outer membrane beta-barrel protein [Roseibacterium elongatum]AHM05884.1 outer membrane protein-like type [Roseibacterium elongatum DSM 19469]
MTYTRKIFGAATAIATIAIAGQAIAGGTVPAPAPAPVPVPAPVVDDFWTGFYVGGALGMGSSNYDIFADIDIPQTINGSIDLPDLGGQGALADIHIGYSHQMSSLVLGAALDATFSNIVNDTSVTGELVGTGSADFDYELSPSEMYSLTLRGGYLVNPDTQVYALVGYTHGTFTGEADLTVRDAGGTTIINESGDYSFDLAGMSFGGGIETRLSDNISLGLEYRYTAFEDYDFIDAPGLNVGFETDVQTARMVVNYRF